MPKSAKKRREKAADFTKVKLKLGKGKAPATNAVDTSFKARSIVLPAQSIGAEKIGGGPTTRRQLTIEDLLSQLKHYNANIRRDALLGLRELLDAHWWLIDSQLSTLLNALVRVIGDEDASVRKQLLALFTWLLPRIPLEDLLPYSSILLLFATSAQTHIFPEIRIDAVRFIDVFLDCMPMTVTSGWYNEAGDQHGHRVLGGYLGILNAGTKYGESYQPLQATSTASVTLTPASKLVVLRSLSTFLNHALCINGSTEAEGPLTHNQPLNAWFMREAFISGEAHSRFEKLLRPPHYLEEERKSTKLNWEDEQSEFNYGYRGLASYTLINQTGNDSSWSTEDLDAMIRQRDGPTSSTRTTLVDFVAHLASALHSTLIDTYLDFAPSIFAPGDTPSETEINLVLTVSRISRTLYHVMFRSPDEEVEAIHVQHLESIIQYMYPYFPSSSKDHKTDQSFEELNLIFCELTSLLANRTSRGASNGRRGGKKSKSNNSGKSNNDTVIPTQQVTEYIQRRLRGESTIPSSHTPSPPLTSTAYLTLLPTIWGLANRPPSSDVMHHHQAERKELMDALLDHALRITSKSATKRLSIEFIGRLILLPSEPLYQGRFQLDTHHCGADVITKFEEWLLHLPRVLWELGNTQLLTTEIIVRLVLRVLQRQPKLADQTGAMESLQARFTPYFHIQHPTRGSMAGPYTKLPSSKSSSSSKKSGAIRFLVLDMIKTMIKVNNNTNQSLGLREAVDMAVCGADEENYWKQA